MFHIESADIDLKVLPCPGRIWMLRCDPYSPKLILELRNEEEKQVSFGVVSESGDSLFILEGVGQDAWWCGIEDFREGLVWLHGYEDQGLPLHQGLCGYESDSGKPLWERKDGAYFGMVEAGILLTATSSTSQEIELLSIKSGEKLSSFAHARDLQLTQALKEYENRRTAQMQFPDTIQPGEAVFEEWKSRLGVQPFGPIWLSRQGKYSVLAWHEGTPEEGFALALAVFEGDKLQLDGWLEEEMKGMHPDPFFLHHGRIIAIQNRKELVIVSFQG